LPWIRTLRNLRSLSSFVIFWLWLFFLCAILIFNVQFFLKNENCCSTLAAEFYLRKAKASESVFARKECFILLVQKIRKKGIRSIIKYKITRFFASKLNGLCKKAVRVRNI
jgi:hypothetical protein